jgi:hypothetical protein
VSMGFRTFTRSTKANKQRLRSMEGCWQAHFARGRRAVLSGSGPWRIHAELDANGDRIKAGEPLERIAPLD